MMKRQFFAPRNGAASIQSDSSILGINLPRVPFCDCCQIFLQSVGLSTATRFILFCPMGKTFSDSDWQFMELIEGFIANQSLPSDLRVLARFPPNDTVQLKDKAKLSHFVFTMPGVRFAKTRGVDWDMNESDLQSLFDSI